MATTYSYLETVNKASGIGDDYVVVLDDVDCRDAPIVNVWVCNTGINALTGGKVESSMNGLSYEEETDPTGLDTLAAGASIHKTYGPGINRYWKVSVKASGASETSVEVRIVRGNTVGPRIRAPLILSDADRAAMEPL